MFAHLSMGMQYLYVCVFSLCVGLSFPVSVPFGMWLISLLVAFGVLPVLGNTWPERLVTHPVWCFFLPLWGLVAFGVLNLVGLILQILFGGFTIMAPGATSDSDVMGLLLSVGTFCLALLFVYMQLKALHLSGGLLLAGMGCVLLGVLLFFVLCQKIELWTLVFMILALCAQGWILVTAGRSAASAPAVAAVESHPNK